MQQFRKNRQQKKKTYPFTVIFPFLTIIGIGVIFTLSSFYQKSWSYSWNGIKENVRDSVLVAQHDIVSNQRVFPGKTKIESFNRRRWIMQNATHDELLKLTSYPNGTIKTIAYEGLLRKKDFQNRGDLVLNSITDTDYFAVYQSGCLATSMEISDYLINYVLYLKDIDTPPSLGINNPLRLSENEIQNILTEYRKASKQ